MTRATPVDDLDAIPVEEDEPPSWLRWYSMALRCPDCGSTPMDPIRRGRLWSLPWIHSHGCPALSRSVLLRPPEFLPRETAAAMRDAAEAS